MIEYIDLLSSSEVEAVYTALYDLKQYWVERHTNPDFFTLGATSNLDGRAAFKGFYFAKAKLFNPILYQEFGWLYERMRAALEEHFREPVCFAESLALPGFNIYIGGLFRQGEQPDPPHYDRQRILRHCQREGAGNLPKQTTYTMAIALPESGSGLYLWDLHAAETLSCTPTETMKLLDLREKTYFPYYSGQMVLHSGLHYHQIAGMEGVQPHDARITLQGHGLFCDGCWQLYF